ncbi:MAG: hypothetical protein IBX50_18180, partial [Marinospirillum sp.]|nr:hypothetical protein [Marinospirillum sp.]
MLHTNLLKMRGSVCKDFRVLDRWGLWCGYHSAISVPMEAIDEVFREVEAGGVDFGVVPIENSTEGVISHTLDSFMDSGLQINGEVVLRIHQHLLVGENTRPDKISTIYSHASSLAQCRKWLDAHYPGVERVMLLNKLQ